MKKCGTYDENWVKYFNAGSRIYVATVDGEIASFCLVTNDASNYLTDAYRHVGMPDLSGLFPNSETAG